MSDNSFLNYLCVRLNSANDQLEQAEIILIIDALQQRFKKACAYCKWTGHTFNQCPVQTEIALRCSSDRPRERVRGRISNDLRLGARLSLGEHLKKHKKVGFR